MKTPVESLRDAIEDLKREIGYYDQEIRNCDQRIGEYMAFALKQSEERDKAKGLLKIYERSLKELTKMEA